MFTGIVQGCANIFNIHTNKNLKTFGIGFPDGALAKVTRGASIAIDGCCLTVTAFDVEKSNAYFDVMEETLRVTNLAQRKVGDQVNFERAAKVGDEIGGHLMSGHVSTTVQLLARDSSDTNCRLTFSLTEQVKKYILPKGFVGINGCSLTVGAEVGDTFSVHLIPETLATTTFNNISVGSYVNLEVDSHTQATVDTVERYLAASDLVKQALKP